MSDALACTSGRIASSETVNSNLIIQSRLGDTMRSNFDQIDYSDVKSWVIKAIEDESRKPSAALWEGAPGVYDAYEERCRIVRFLRKCSKFEPRAIPIADRLDICEPT